MSRLITVSLTTVLCLMSYANANARVYRCTDADGKISYSQTPCPAETKSDTLRLGSNKEPLNKDLCQLARYLAITSYTDMQAGSDPSVVIDEYGGTNYITPATLSVINFAASLRYNDNLDPQRVGAMAFARCSEGGFGQLNEGDLPVQEEEEVMTSDTVPGNLPVMPISPETAQLATPQGSTHTTCQNYETRIDAINSQMRQGQSSERMAALRKERENYEQLYSEDCRNR